MSTNKILCPKCNLADQIQKVSAIVATGTSRQASISTSDTISGTVGGGKVYGSAGNNIGSYQGSSGSYGYTTTTVEGVGRTDLAAALAPPDPPEAPLKKNIDWWDKQDKLKVIAMLVLGLGTGWLIGAGALFVMESIVGYGGDVVVVFGGLMSLVAAYITHQFFKNTIRKQYPFIPKSVQIEAENARMDKAYKAKLQTYNEQMELWSRLYYCHRDDHVFEPIE